MITIAADGDAWQGISCTSWIWPHSALESPQFEVRRAVANLTHGLRSSLEEQEDPQPAAEDVLHFVEAAHQIEQAAKKTLEELVLEARKRGATWEQIGEKVGTNRRAAHERFAKKAPEPKVPPSLAKEISSSLIASWRGEIPESRLGYDESEWEAAPPLIVAQHSLRNVFRAHSLIHAAIMSEDNPLDSELMQRCIAALSRAIRAFTQPRVLSVFVETSREIDALAWSDVNPMVYLVRIFYLTTLANVLLFDFYQVPEINKFTADGERDPLYSFVLAYSCLEEAVMAGLRPEFTKVMAKIEAAVVRQGDAPYHPSDVFNEEDEAIMQRLASQGVDAWDVLSAFWRNDLSYLAGLYGVDESKFEKSFTASELIKLIEDGEI